MSILTREPIFNLPGVVTALIAGLCAVHLAIEALPAAIGLLSLEYFSFVPAKLSLQLAPARALQELAELDAEDLTLLAETSRFVWITPLSYAFLHANWTHLGVNAVTLAAFGAPVARRLGAPRFLAFFAVTAVAGAAAHFLAHPFDTGPVVGASASISGAMAAIARFAFQPGGALGEPAGLGDRRGDASDGLPALLANRRAAFFLGSWLLANLIFGLLAPAPGGVGAIAWEAHVGGFLAGLMLFGWFDPPTRKTSA